MSDEIRKLEPLAIWENFYQLTQIPRPSKKEMGAAIKMKEFGEKLGLETVMDEVGNVIIRKEASPGYENKKGVVLQGHIDMVPQANSGIDFNFETDPIETYIDGDWVTAKDTTLGADNGIGVAMGMALLQQKDLEHGPIEVLITVDEESGMTGAFALKQDVLKGDILINLDTEDFGELSVGCAGGVNVNFVMPKLLADVQKDTSAFKLELTGLKGGHSGLDIHLGRGNACKLMIRFLKEVITKLGARLASIDCGNMRNAIPREGFSIVTVPNENKEAFLNKVTDFESTWKNELGRVEPDLSFIAKETELPDSLLDEMVQDDLVNAVFACRNGIVRMSDSMPGVVESSTNLSIVKSNGEQIEGMCLVRSFVDSAKMGIASSLESCFRLAGANVVIDGEYPGWKPNPDSEILKTSKEVYEKQYGEVPEAVAMHAGLECGILGATYPNWDMISMGPTIRYPHSPDEKVQISTVAKAWDFLLNVLKNVPEK